MDVSAILLVLVGAITILTQLADLFGPIRVQWWRRRLLRIGMLLLGLLTTFVGLRIPEYSKDIEGRVSEMESVLTSLIRESRGVQVQRFETTADVYAYVAHKVRSAEKSVDDITWGMRTEHRTEAEEAAYRDYLDAMDAACQKSVLAYREVAALADTHYYGRAARLVEKGYLNYSLGYYDISSPGLPPPLSYVIVDGRELIMGFYRDPEALAGEVYLAITDPTVVALFSDYYEVLWSKAHKLKAGHRVDAEKMSAILDSLTVRQGR